MKILLAFTLLLLTLDVNAKYLRRRTPEKSTQKTFTVKIPRERKPQNVPEEEVKVFKKVLNELTNRLHNEVDFNEKSKNTTSKEKMGCFQKYNVNMHEKGTIIPITSDLSLQSLLYEEIGFWSRCTRSCKSKRARKCRLPGLCAVDFMIEEAHCFAPGSKCEEKVKNELGLQEKEECSCHEDGQEVTEDHEHSDDDHSRNDDHHHDHSYDDNEVHNHDHDHTHDYDSHDFEHNHEHDHEDCNEDSHTHDHSHDYEESHSQDYHDSHDSHHTEYEDSNKVAHDYVTFVNYPVVIEEDYPSYSYGDSDVDYDGVEDDIEEDEEKETEEGANGNEADRQVCGKSKVSVPYEMFRIIGGREAMKGAWPWQVAIFDRFGVNFCGGTLIAGNWVLTAAHCIRKKISVRIADHDISRHDGEVKLRVKKVIKHPRYNAETFANDIALLKLPINVMNSVDVIARRACLPPDGSVPEVNKKCVVLGWGKERETHIYGSDVLMFAKVPIVSMKKCKSVYDHREVTDDMICAGYLRGGPDSCEGDSGGPLLCRNENDQWVVEGITSFGEGCGDRGQVGVYTRVVSYLDWINKTMTGYE